MKTTKNTQVTALLTALATAAVTIAQAAGVHITTSTGHTALVSGIVAAITTLLHGTGVVIKKSTISTITMYDTITPEDIPPNAKAVAGYISGKWPTFPRLITMFPNAKRLSISPNAALDADCLDVENGDASPEEAPGWVIRQHKRGKAKPWLYCNKSTLPIVLSHLKTAGIKRSTFILWIADPTNKAHIIRDTDATQWGWHALGRNLDVSLVKVSAFE